MTCGGWLKLPIKRLKEGDEHLPHARCAWGAPCWQGVISAESFALIAVITLLGDLLSEAQEWVPRTILMLLRATLWP